MKNIRGLLIAAGVLLAGIFGFAPETGTHAETSSPMAKQYWIIEPTGEPWGFALRNSAKGQIAKVTVSEGQEAAKHENTRLLLDNLNRGHLRLALDGYFSLSEEKYQKVEDGVSIAVVKRLGSSSGLVIEAGQVQPPQNFDSRANAPTVMADWLVAQAKGGQQGPEGYKHAWRDPATHSAFMLANQAVMRIAYLRSVDNGIRFSLFDPAQNRTDAIGSAIFNGSVLALTKYAAAEMTLKGHPSGMTKPNDYVYAYDADALWGVSESGPMPAGILALSRTWAEPWAGLDAYEDKAQSIAVGPVTGVMQALLSNAGPQAIKTVLDDPFPYNKMDGIGRNSLGWVGWLDEQIRKTGNKVTPWGQHRQFIAERGFAGAYVTALSDLLAIPERAIESGGGKRSLPAKFRDGEYLDAVFEKHPCREYAFSLGNPVQEFSLAMPEVASRCIRIRWAGEGVGPDLTTPPVTLSIEGEGMKLSDYDDILIASAHGEMAGLTIADASSQRGVKLWSLPYRADYEGAKWMTLAFANIAPDVQETQIRKLRITLGTGLTSGSGSVSSVADASKAGSNQACRPIRVASPDTYGAAPHPTGVFGETGLEALLGLSALTKGSPRSDTSVAIAMCTANTLHGSLNLKNDLASGLGRSGEGEGSLSCLSSIGAKALVYGVKPTRPEIVSINLTPRQGAVEHEAEMTVPVDADVSFFIPELASARSSGKVDYRGNPRVSMEGVVTFQIRTSTRLRGRVDLRTSADSIGDCGDTPNTGSMTFVFDMVAGLPFNSRAVAVPPDALSTISPAIWATMTVSQREKVIADGKQARNEALAGSSGSTDVAWTAGCDCSCAEFNDPARKQVCDSECGDFQATAPQCLIEREVSRGTARSRITELLNACPSDCAALSSADPLCREALPMISKACKADTVTPADKACYLRLLTEDMPEPMKSQIYAEMKSTLASMDQDTLKLSIRPQLEFYKEQGKSCPVN